MTRPSPTGRLSWHMPGPHRLPPTTEEAKRIIAAWRQQAPKIIAFWTNLERRIR